MILVKARCVSLLWTALLCNGASLERADGKWTVVSDPPRALCSLRVEGWVVGKVGQEQPLLGELP